MSTGIFYLSFRPGPGRQPITLPNRKRAYIRVTETTSSLVEAFDESQPEPDEHVLNTHELPGPAPEASRIAAIIALLRTTPHLTSAQIGRRLNVRTSTVSSLLYREMIKPTSRVMRRLDRTPGHGWEWFVTSCSNE